VGIGTASPQGLVDVHSGEGGDSTSALFVRASPSFSGLGGVIHHQSSTYAWQELAQFHLGDGRVPGSGSSASGSSSIGSGSRGGCGWMGRESQDTRRRWEVFGRSFPSPLIPLPWGEEDQPSSVGRVSDFGLMWYLTTTPGAKLQSDHAHRQNRRSAASPKSFADAEELHAV
jgi:hypothetical protein